MIIVAILHFLLALASGVLRRVGASILASRQMGNEDFSRMFSGAWGVVSLIVGLLVAAIILVGGIKMKRLESYGLAMTGSIVAMLPCSLCCLVGLPIGIWALVVLSKPEVKSAFH